MTTVPISLKILLKGQLKYINNYFEVIGISSSGPELNEVSKREGVNVLAVNMTRIISPFNDLISLVKMTIVLINEKPYIIHTHTPKAGLIGMLAARIVNVPVRLHTVAGLPLMEEKGVKRFILNSIEKLIYFCATRVYPNSQGLYNFILENNFTSRNKLRIISNGSSNGIDCTYFDISKISHEKKSQIESELNLTASQFKFIYIGRLVKDKGINELISAFTNLNLRNVKLILLGSYEMNLDPLYKETIEKIDSDPNIIHVGFKEDIRPYYAVSDCLIFPSYREGFPNVVLQAGSMGLPSIVSDINGCNEIIKDGDNGLIIPSKNVRAIEIAMLKMLNDESLFVKCKQNARDMIVNRYEQEAIWGKLLEEYNSFELENLMKN